MPYGPRIDISTTSLPREVQAIRHAIALALKADDPQRPGQTLGQARAGVYAFYDFDGEPIYVGQTAEGFGIRIGRHLTGQRSDAVARHVLDPFEVHTVSMWSLPEIGDLPYKERKAALDPYGFTVYQKLLRESTFGAILNEGDFHPGPPQELPAPVVRIIVPDDIFPDRSHPDVRIARQARTISLLASSVTERRVSAGARRTLATQTARLNALIQRRFEALDRRSEAPEGLDDFAPEDSFAEPDYLSEFYDSDEFSDFDE
ncbi:GIY-YIG nuclease family protein [Micromonospora sp. NPDC085948]|uniref:GIY-YIG nuclease family protein n=1 Tax=Micromonospora sp. NPDC085948 TaxID=3155293 RepID=UPI00341B5EB2